MKVKSFERFLRRCNHSWKKSESRVLTFLLTAVASSIGKKILLRTKLFSSFLVLAKVYIDLALANLLFWDGLNTSAYLFFHILCISVGDHLIERFFFLSDIRPFFKHRSTLICNTIL